MRLANLHRPVLVEVHLLRLRRHPLSTAPTPWAHWRDAGDYGHAGTDCSLGEARWPPE